MKIEKEAAQQLLDELTKSEIVVTFFDKIIEHTGKLFHTDEDTGEIEEIDVDFKEFRPFSISINNKFRSSYEELSLYPDPKYRLHLGNLRNKVIAEIDNNINLRIGKWDIFNYLTNLTSELQEIRNKFGVSEVILQSEKGEALNNSNFPLAEGEFPDYDNLNIEIIVKSDDGVKELTKDDIFHMNFILARYWDIQVLTIERLIRIIEQRKSIIEKTDDYVRAINTLPTQNTILWTKTDTDLLELIIALHEAGAIQNATKDLTQKEAIQAFSDFFGKEMKDQYKKLNAARNRKKEDPGFIPKIQKALEAYYQCLNERM